MAYRSAFYNGPTGPFYLERFFAEVAEQFDLSEDEMSVVREHLEDAASDWHHMKDEPPADPTKYRSVIEDIANWSARAATKASAVPDEVWDLLASVGRIAGDETAPSLDYDPHAVFGLGGPTLTTRAKQNPSGTKAYRGRANPIDLLEDLEWLAIHALLLDPRRKGPEPDYLLRQWVRQIANLWAGHLKRPFTREFHDDGEPISEAARFLVLAYGVLDPEMPKSRIDNEMKKLIKSVRNPAF